jgi:hypothetical protein
MGVVSDLPVLGSKDTDDVQNFSAKHMMDYVFASFVQSADEMWMIRRVIVLHLALRPCRFYHTAAASYLGPISVGWQMKYLGLKTHIFF